MTLDPSKAPSSGRPDAPATIADWLAIPEESRAELIDGRIVFHAMPGPSHGIVQSGIAVPIRGGFHGRAGGPERPGGWWISQEVDAEIGGIGCRPDLLGWQRDKHPRIPAPDARGVVIDPPQWICEVLSRSTAVVDMGAKRRAYHRAGVSWYWIADPANRTLTVLRHTDADYLVVLVVGVDERVRAEPFEAIEINVGDVFDLNDEGPPPA